MSFLFDFSSFKGKHTNIVRALILMKYAKVVQSHEQFMSTHGRK